MRKVLMLPLSAALFTAPALAEERYEIDESHVHVMFEVSHLGYSTTIGQFDDVDGVVMVDWDDPAASELDVTIDAASVDTNWEKRDEHLRSADFFHVEEHPDIRFVARRIEKTGERTGKIHGDLTMLGETRPLVLDATLNKHEPRNGRDWFGISATGEIKRSDFGMSYGVPAVGDEVDLRIEAEFGTPAAEETD